jgi:hypothetical protein
VLQEGNGKLKGEAAVVVPTSGDHHEPHEIVGPLSAKGIHQRILGA